MGRNDIEWSDFVVFDEGIHTAKRGGNQSADSLAISKSILRVSTVLCTFAVGCQGVFNRGVTECAYSNSNLPGTRN